jgi:hypothetical protein
MILARFLLQRLGPEDSQFVYDAAAAHTVDIATHRHGCCVLQRCIDFATPAQKRRLIDQIASHALPLSQVQLVCCFALGVSVDAAFRAVITLRFRIAVTH